ncbi:MAG: CPBP family intramembrane metalloprotease [Sedimentisphaerales bacterium]|nr:CPBP family intramembrane metalloprotease [Sedimentisphaerales bacterium]
MYDENQIQPSENRSDITEAGPCCSYCGAQLNPVFYFCVVCATPYKPVSAAISASIPRQLTEGELIEKRAPNVWRVFWSYVILMFLLGLSLVLVDELGGGTFQEEDMKYSWFLLGSIGFLLLTSVFSVRYWRSLLVQFKNIGFDSVHAWSGMVILLGLLCILVVYEYFLTGVANLFPGWGDHETSVLSSQFSWAEKIIFLCLLPGITEEIAFRGLIQHWLQVAIRPWRAVLLAAALFTALHLSIISAPYIFLVGILLGWVKWKTGSLYPSMFIHVLHNFAVLTMFPFIFPAG